MTVLRIVPRPSEETRSIVTSIELFMFSKEYIELELDNKAISIISMPVCHCISLSVSGHNVVSYYEIDRCLYLHCVYNLGN